MLLRALPALALLAGAAASTCSSSADCELLGSCVGGACVCQPGWRGASCGELDLAPAAACAGCLPLWPVASASRPGAAGSSAWGFSPLFDATDGLWHAFVTVACGGDGVVGDGGGQSWIAHLTSAQPDRGFSLLGPFSPQTTFGPHVLSLPGGSGVAVVFRVNELLTAPVCGGNGSDPLPADFLAHAAVPASELVSGDPEKGTSIWLAQAPSAGAAAWTVTRLNVTGCGDVHKSNPSITALADGRFAMAYRYNPPGGSLNALAVSDAGVAGPYRCVTNVTAGKGGDEDPFVWEAADGAIHLLWHNKNFGYHGFATGVGAPFSLSPTGAHAFTLNVSTDDGRELNLLRRERPELRFAGEAAARVPVALIAAVQAQDTTCFALSQATTAAAAVAAR
jgi:hypothetical protein